MSPVDGPTLLKRGLGTPNSAGRNVPIQEDAPSMGTDIFQIPSQGTPRTVNSPPRTNFFHGAASRNFQINFFKLGVFNPQAFEVFNPRIMKCARGLFIVEPQNKKTH